MLVAAVLRPEQREDRELEVVRVAREQLPDSVELPVGETEGSVERLLLRDRTQEAIVPAGPDDTSAAHAGAIESAATTRRPPFTC
jgi:hypothetical protein